MSKNKMEEDNQDTPPFQSKWNDSYPPNVGERELKELNIL